MKRLLVDIETSPNVAFVWGLWNQNIAPIQLAKAGETLCWAAKWAGEDDVIFNSSWGSSFKDMIQHIHSLLEEADAVIHFNGTKFDIPTLNKEFVLEKLNPPLGYTQVDLYRVAKKQFRFPSNKLDYICRALGIGQKVPHKGMELWLECMEGDEHAQNLMEAYNIGDVLLLEKLYNRLLPWINTHPNMGLYIDSDTPVCTNCGSKHIIKKGWQYTKTQKYQRYKCKDCGTNLRSRFTLIDQKDRHNILVQA